MASCFRGPSSIDLLQHTHLDGGKDLIGGPVGYVAKYVGARISSTYSFFFRTLRFVIVKIRNRRRGEKGRSGYSNLAGKDCSC